MPFHDPDSLMTAADLRSVCYFSILPPCSAHDAFSPIDTFDTPAQSPIANDFTTPTTPADSYHPLLAFRATSAPPSLPSPAASPVSGRRGSLLQMQTAGAHGNHHQHHHTTSSRPRPYPVQNMLHVTSDDDERLASISGSESSSSSAASSTANSSRCSTTSSSLDLARCSRCQRTPSVDVRTGKSNMVSYGLNLWYCSRCASLVGLNR